MNYRVKKRWLILGTAMVAGLAALIFFVCFLQIDDNGYKEILDRANPSLSLETEHSYRVSQLRKGVQKNFWYVKGNTRLEMVLKGNEAEVAYEKEGDKQEIVEVIKGARCLLQEELLENGLFPMQTVRSIDADTAKYHYKTATLTANRAKMSLYTLPGHQLPHSLEAFTPTMTSSADSVDVTAASITLHHNIEAAFSGLGTLTTDKEIVIQRDPSSKHEFSTIRCEGDTSYTCENEKKGLDLTAHCFGEILIDSISKKVHLKSYTINGEDSNQLYFQDHLGKIFSDEAFIYYDFKEGKPLAVRIELLGNVKLINREGALLQYAMANKVVYENETKEMHFTALPKKRVLFYDKINNLEVSAPELKMKRDAITKENQFQGVGDVRFRFAEEEFEQLRKRFLLEKKGL